ADAGDEGDVLPLEPELGQQGPDGGQDDVVATAGAPAHLLVGGVVLGLLRSIRLGHGRQRVERQCAADEAGFGGGHGVPLLARRSAGSVGGGGAGGGVPDPPVAGRGLAGGGDDPVERQAVLVVLGVGETAGELGLDGGLQLLGR